MSKNQLFAKKSLDVLLAEMAGEHRLRRVLGPVALSSLGIGAIIGTGIFVLTGVAARQHAGPGLILSFVIAGFACAFAALCYAEFASMAPIAGSAYTYAYVSLGELMAWIIGWDLVLEYMMASATVANGWSHYFISFLSLFKVNGRVLLAIPAWLATDPFTAATQHVDYRSAAILVVETATGMPMRAEADTVPLALPVKPEQSVERVQKVQIAFTATSEAGVRDLHGPGAEASIQRIRNEVRKLLEYEPNVLPQEMVGRVKEANAQGYTAYEQTPLVMAGYHLTFNAAAIGITAILTVILVLGIRESANFNAGMVLVKILVVLFVIIAGARFIDPTNWTPFMPYGWPGIGQGAALIFFAYIGFDSVSTHAEEARRPHIDVPIGIIASLAVCTVLYIAVAAVITGMVPYPQIPLNAPIAGVFEKFGVPFALYIINVGALTGITSVLLVMMLSQPRVLLAMARDGLLPFSFFGAVHPRFRTPHRATILTGVVVALVSSLFPLEAMGHMVNIGTLFAFVVVCSAVWLMRWISPEAKRPFRTPMLHFVAPAGILFCLVLMCNLDWENWVRLFVWLAVGLLIYCFYSRHHSHLGKELRGEISLHGVSPAGTPAE